jgi:hypothetical protein
MTMIIEETNSTEERPEVQATTSIQDRASRRVVIDGKGRECWAKGEASARIASFLHRN